MKLRGFIIISGLQDNEAILMLFLYSKIFERKAVNACDRIIVYLMNNSNGTLLGSYGKINFFINDKVRQKK